MPAITQKLKKDFTHICFSIWYLLPYSAHCFQLPCSLHSIDCLLFTTWKFILRVVILNTSLMQLSYFRRWKGLFGEIALLSCFNVRMQHSTLYSTVLYSKIPSKFTFTKLLQKKLFSKLTTNTALISNCYPLKTKTKTVLFGIQPGLAFPEETTATSVRALTCLVGSS